MYKVLNNGIKMPDYGFGTYKSGDYDLTVQSVKEAIKTGYRYIDTASFYGNEDAVGEGIKESGVPREELFIATKVWQNEQGYENTLEAFERSSSKLQTSYIDLYLIHWPTELNSETWRALEKLYRDGRVKAIGVCNFKIKHLEKLMETAEIMPMVNQIQLHPELKEKELTDFCEAHKIQIISWSPIARGRIFEIPLIKELADKYKKTQAQITLRWHYQHGFIAIPKSSKIERIKENYNIFDFEISKEDMLRLDALDKGIRVSSVPKDSIFEL